MDLPFIFAGNVFRWRAAEGRVDFGYHVAGGRFVEGPDAAIFERGAETLQVGDAGEGLAAAGAGVGKLPGWLGSALFGGAFREGGVWLGCCQIRASVFCWAPPERGGATGETAIEFSGCGETVVGVVFSIFDEFGDERPGNSVASETQWEIEAQEDAAF